MNACLIKGKADSLNNGLCTTGLIIITQDQRMKFTESKIRENIFQREL